VSQSGTIQSLFIIRSAVVILDLVLDTLLEGCLIVGQSVGASEYGDLRRRLLMKYKLIISDFDGTLAWYDHKVTKRTIEAIKAYQDKGGIFTISTGRSYETLAEHLPKYGLDKVDLPIGCYNGAAVYSSKTGKPLVKYSIPNSLAIEWLQHLEQYDVYVQCYVDDTIYIKHRAKFSDIYARGQQVNFVQVGNLVQFLTKTGFEPSKFVIVGTPDRTLEIDYIYNKLYKYLFGDLTFMQSHAQLFEIISAKASKGVVAQEIASMLNIPLSRTVCIGDNDNDISMLLVAGLSVAVDNARTGVKRVAKYHTWHCSDDGVANVLEQAVLDELP
jgi:Cof subfamily protein (haloacid dehalogenase superfamily)